jgi:hypothetical protein
MAKESGKGGRKSGKVGGMVIYGAAAGKNNTREPVGLGKIL